MSKVLVAIDKSKSYRVYLTISTDMVEAARVIHNTSSTATAGLGRVLTATGMMGLMLKNHDDKVTVQFKGDGPAKMILATANQSGDVKGYIANPDVDLPYRPDGHLDVGGSLNVGQLTVIKDTGMAEPYVGKIELVSGEIAEDLTAYFFISEQQNSSVALGVRIGIEGKVTEAGGMIIQMLPNYDPEAVDALETMISSMTAITTAIEHVNTAYTDTGEVEKVQSLLDYLFRGMSDKFKPEVISIADMRWYCDCSKGRFEKALITIGKKDMTEIIEEDGQAEIVCQFCTKPYVFHKEELEDILHQM